MSPICGHRSEFVTSCGARDGLREDGKCWRHTGQPDWVAPVSLGEQLAARDAEIARLQGALEYISDDWHVSMEHPGLTIASCEYPTCVKARAALKPAGETT